MNTGPDAYSVAKSVHWWKGSRRPQTEFSVCSCISVFRMSHLQVLNDELQSFYLRQSRFKSVEFNLNSIVFACHLFKFWTTNCSRFFSGLSRFKAVEFNLNSNWTKWRRSEVKWSELDYWKKWDDNLWLIWWKKWFTDDYNWWFCYLLCNLGSFTEQK
jgi:hypothetical protein